jgi:hypothetical protein
MDNLKVNSMKTRNKTTKKRVIVLLDKSGSMDDIIEDVFGSYNNFIKEQKEIKDDTLYTLITFSNGPVTKENIIIDDIKLQDVNLLKRNEYIPNGCTALYDAIGFTISHIEMKNDKYENLLIIITDGKENNSREYKKESIKTKIENAQKNGWKIEYLCVSFDKFVNSENISFANYSGISYTGNLSIKDTMKCSSTITRGFRK